MASSIVTADPQFSNRYLLRPYAGFTTDYQGQASNTPIALTEVVDPPAGAPRDSLAAARTALYDPNLVRGLPVPFGSRIVLWLPSVVVGADAGRYVWTLVWRLRNLNDHLLTGQPYHVPTTDPGVIDTIANQGRVAVPAAWQTVTYAETPAPATNSGSATASIRNESLSTGAIQNPVRPLLPGGVPGVVAQGILNPGTTPPQIATAPQWQATEVQALGDELVLLCTRATSLGTWDFAGNDASFGSYFGNASPQYGVYVLVGTAP